LNLSFGNRELLFASAIFRKNLQEEIVVILSLPKNQKNILTPTDYKFDFL